MRTAFARRLRTISPTQNALRFCMTR